jgi:RHS repeat-associated protein
VYNGDGQRVERSGTLEFARFVWDGQNIHLRLDADNGLLDYYAYEPRLYGNLVASGLPARWFQYNEQGSTQILTGEDGLASDIYFYSAWGEVLAHGNNASRNPYLYLGRLGYYCDDEDLNKSHQRTTLPLQVRAGLYQPRWGRWLRPDPLRTMVDWLNAMAAGGPAPGPWLAILRQPYVYVGNNPVNGNDPSGLQIISPTAPGYPPRPTPTWSPLYGPFNPFLFRCDPACLMPNPNFRNTPTKPACSAPLIGDTPPGAGVSFESCCAAHDICWGTCGGSQARCDRSFLNCLLRKCDKSPNPFRCGFWARIYYDAVNASSDRFAKVQSEACICSCPDRGPTCFGPLIV